MNAGDMQQLTKSLEVEERLASLNRLDTQITSILSKGIRVLRAVSNGKRTNDKRAKEDFTKALKEYNELIGVVNSDLRAEVKKLHVASSTDVLPLNLPTLANEFGHDKEQEIWRCIYSNLEGCDEDMEIA